MPENMLLGLPVRWVEPEEESQFVPIVLGDLSEYVLPVRNTIVKEFALLFQKRVILV
jgi:hypothetical protein